MYERNRSLVAPAFCHEMRTVGVITEPILYSLRNFIP